MTADDFAAMMSEEIEKEEDDVKLTMIDVDNQYEDGDKQDENQYENGDKQDDNQYENGDNQYENGDNQYEAPVLPPDDKPEDLLELVMTSDDVDVPTDKPNKIDRPDSAAPATDDPNEDKPTDGKHYVHGLCYYACE